MIFFWRNNSEIRKLSIDIAIVILILFGVYLLKLRSKNWAKEDCEIQRTKEIRGRIDTAFFDYDINVKAFVVVFQSGERYLNPIYLKSLNGYVQKDDSIYKPSGSFVFYRYDNLNWSEILNQDSLYCSILK